MSSTTLSQYELQPLIVSYWEGGEPQPAPPAESAFTVDNVFVAEFSPKPSDVAGEHSDFDALLTELDSDPESAAEMSNARRWIQEAYYAEEGDTLRSARLRKGYSQKQLAAILETSQPHIANIENGKNNLLLSTAIKLCEVLDVDLRALPEMIERQLKLNAERNR